MIERIYISYPLEQYGVTLPADNLIHNLRLGTLEKIPIALTQKPKLQLHNATRRAGNGFWHLLTMLEDTTPIGFADLHYIVDSPMGAHGNIGNTYLSKTADVDIPFLAIRTMSGEDAIYVREDMRGIGIGVALLFNALAISKDYGGKGLSINNSKRTSDPWYEKLGGKPHLNGFTFFK